MEHPLQLLSVTDYWYIVTLNSGGASLMRRREVSACHLKARNRLINRT